MKDFKIMGLIVLSCVLSACGLIPPQAVSNPLGLDGQTLDVVIAGSSALQVQAVGQATATGGFADIDSPLSPANFEINQAFASTVRVTVSQGDLPSRIELSNLQLSVSVSDESRSTEFTLEPSGTATLTQLSGSNYSLSELRFSGNLRGSVLNQLNPILTSGGFNTVTASLSLTTNSTPDLPAGSSLTLSFASGSGSVSF